MGKNLFLDQMCERAAESYALKSPKPSLRRTGTSMDSDRRLSNAGALPQRTSSADLFANNNLVSSAQVCVLF